MTTPEQPDLFGGKQPQPAPAADGAKRAPAPPDAAPTPAAVSEEIRDLGRVLPPRLYIGTSSWAFTGWAGLVYAESMNESRLSRDGLVAYAKHPLLRSVSIDRGYYGAMRTDEYARYAEQVPPAFRFVVKAPAAVSDRFLRGEGGRPAGDNPRYLDAAFAAEQFVAPCIEGLGDRAGVLLFQFAPQPIGQLGGVGRFADALHAFLSALPRGPRYAVELRNTQLLAPSVADALHDVGAIPALSAWSGLPPVEEQARRLRAHEAPVRVIRWMLQEGGSYEDARDRFAPFDVLAEPDPVTRAAIARLVNATAEDTYVIVNNKAEGSAPRSVFALAEAIARGA